MANNDKVGELQEKVISDQVNMTDISPAATEDIFSESGFGTIWGTIKSPQKET